MGIYGYAAYSASKFALRGLAEALQQEVIAEDIHLSLIFPPDTETPGLAEGIYINELYRFFILISCNFYWVILRLRNAVCCREQEKT